MCTRFKLPRAVCLSFNFSLFIFVSRTTKPFLTKLFWKFGNCWSSYSSGKCFETLWNVDAISFGSLRLKDVRLYNIVSLSVPSQNHRQAPLSTNLLTIWDDGVSWCLYIIYTKDTYALDAFTLWMLLSTD